MRLRVCARGLTGLFDLFYDDAYESRSALAAGSGAKHAGQPGWVRSAFCTLTAAPREKEPGDADRGVSPKFPHAVCCFR
jgi:hypothetical protein